MPKIAKVTARPRTKDIEVIKPLVLEGFSKPPIYPNMTGNIDNMQGLRLVIIPPKNTKRKMVKPPLDKARGRVSLKKDSYQAAFGLPELRALSKTLLL